MADFQQPSHLPTLHHLAPGPSAGQEAEMKEWTRDRPLVVLLPALFAECERPAFPHILEELAGVDYVSEVVVTMNGMNSSAQCDMVANFLRRHLGGKKARLLWNDGPPMAALWQEMEAAGGGHYQPGKGSNIWMGAAWLLAEGHRGLVVSHDTDILNYTRSLVWKLCLPLLHPRMGYRFVKGYYGRVADRLYGRVTRLLVFPLIQAFEDVLGPLPLIRHLQSFRYPLSGEFGADMETLGSFSLPPGWGLEIGMLAESHRNLQVEQMCQVDLGFHFEHRHRQLTPGGVAQENGLINAAMEVAGCLAFKILAQAGPQGAAALLREVLAGYKRRGPEWARRYEHVSLINGLQVHLDGELEVIEAFVQALEQQLEDPSFATRPSPGMRPAPQMMLEKAPELTPMLQTAAIEL